MRVAVAGGTGWIGRLVVEAVHANRGAPVVLARSTGVDLTRGKGLDDKLSGASVVIDVSNLQTTCRKKSIAFFEAATSSLRAAEERAGVTHHVALSIVGSERVGFGYYLGKRRQEALVLSSRVPGPCCVPSARRTAARLPASAEPWRRPTGFRVFQQGRLP